MPKYEYKFIIILVHAFVWFKIVNVINNKIKFEYFKISLRTPNRNKITYFDNSRL